MRGEVDLSHLALSRTWARLRYRFAETQWARALHVGRQRTAVSGQSERNIRYLYIEIFWAALFSAVFTFNATYALRLGATNQMVGWLSSLPSLFAMFLMVPAARFLETKSDRAPWLNTALFVGRTAFWGTVLIPWLTRSNQAEWLVALLIVRTIPITFFNAGFGPLVADVVPERKRASVFSTRNIISSATVAVATYAAGRWLDAAARNWAPFPLNYQLLYILGSVGAVMSAFFVSKIEAPPTPVVQREPRSRSSGLPLRETVALFQQELRGNPAFARLVVDTLLFNLGAWIAMPLYTILFVRRLNATDSWIGLSTTLAHLGVIAGYALFRPVIQRWGDGRTLLATVIPTATFPLLVGLFPNLTLILVWQVLINLLASGVNLSHTNMFYRSCPEAHRATYMAAYSSIINLGAFVCPMIGVALADVIDIRWVIVGAGVFRLLGAATFHIWPIEVRQEPQQEGEEHDST